MTNEYQAQESTADSRKEYVVEMRNTTRSGCCCCNLWIAANSWIFFSIFGPFLSIVLLLVRWEDHTWEDPDVTNMFISLDLFTICSALIGLYGLRKCEPECIGIFVFGCLSVALASFLELLGATIIHGFLPMWAVLTTVCSPFIVWWTIVLLKAYKVARKHKFGARCRVDSSIKSTEDV